MSNIPDKAWLPDYQVLGDVQSLDNNVITIRYNNQTYSSTNYTLYRYTGVQDKNQNPVYERDSLYTENLQYIGTIEEAESGFRITTPILVPNLNINKASNYYIRGYNNETL